MADMNETRVTHRFGTCPACQAALEVVLRVELGTPKISSAPSQHAVKVEFGEPTVTGAVVKPHDCMKRDETQPRSSAEIARDIERVREARPRGRIIRS